MGDSRRSLAKPVRALRARVALFTWTSGIAVVSSGAWLGWSACSVTTATGPTIDDSGRVEGPVAAVGRAGIDLAVFNAALWVQPAKPPEPVMVAAIPPASPPPPLKLQLIGLESSERNESVAVLFDPDAAKMIRGSAGDRVGRYVIRAIDAEGVALEDDEYPGKPKQTLRMKSRISLQPGSGGLAK